MRVHGAVADTCATERNRTSASQEKAAPLGVSCHSQFHIVGAGDSFVYQEHHVKGLASKL